MQNRCNLGLYFAAQIVSFGLHGLTYIYFFVSLFVCFVLRGSAVEEMPPGVP